MDISTKLRLIQEGFSIELINESDFNFPLPQWKDENKVTYEKQQLKSQIGKLRKQNMHNPNPEVTKQIEELESRYNHIVSSTPPSIAQQKNKIKQQIFLLQRAGKNEDKISELERQLRELEN